MREIKSEIIQKTVKELFIDANKNLPEDIKRRIEFAQSNEKTRVCKNALDSIIANLYAAREEDIPICQDTGMAVLFAEIGQDVHITGDYFEDAVNKGVHDAYIDGYLRCSVVNDPLIRKNTKDNTPAVIHTKIVPGDKIALTAVPKGFGSENMSALKMFNPSATKRDIIDFAVKTVSDAGSKPCPPIVVGIGIGSDFEGCAILSKKALIRSTDIRNASAIYGELEKDILNAINKTGIGAQGFGGSQTCLAVNIEQAPTHIAGLPVAVNIGCHVTRHKTLII